MMARTQSLGVEAIGTSVSAQAGDIILHGVTSVGVPNFDDRGLILAAARKVYPFGAIADWTHDLPINATDSWMDGIGRDQFYHRWKGHHLLADGVKALSDPHLSAIDFTKHLTLDVITLSGIPLLPTSGIQLLSDALGVSVHKVIPLVSKNIFDLSISCVSIGQAVSDLHLAFTGHLEWGTRTAILTIGGGAMTTGYGLAIKDPFCVAGGLGQIGAGAISFCDYYSQPFVLGVPLSDLLAGLGCGAVSGLICSALTVGLNWNRTTPEQKTHVALKNLSLGVFVGGLSAITPWLSVPFSAGWSLGNFAVHLAHQQKIMLQEHRLSSPWAMRAALLEMVEQKGAEATITWLRKQSQRPSVPGFENFIEAARKRIAGREKSRGARTFQRQFTPKAIE